MFLLRLVGYALIRRKRVLGPAKGQVRRDWSYSAVVPRVLRTTTLPLPPAAEKGADAGGSWEQPRHDAGYWDGETQGLDFSVEDNLDVARFNHVLWAGLAGGRPYPEKRDGRDLRKGRRSPSHP